MTYCVGVLLKDGIVLASDSRTHAGVDDFSSFCKMTVCERPGDRVLVLLSSGAHPEWGVRRGDSESVGRADDVRRASFILGGQISGEPMRLFRIYAEGNFIEVGTDTPFLQTGETKYGKPIMDGVIDPSTSLSDAAKCVLVSFDSTIRSNLSVGMPIDLLCYERDTLGVRKRRRFEQGDPYFGALSKKWSEGVRAAFKQLPDPEWGG